MGFENGESALNQFVKFWGDNKQIVGVIKNYHHFGFKSEIEPLVLIHMPIVVTQLLVKLEDKQLTSAGLQNSLAQIKTIWEKQFQQSTFEYNFIDQTFAAQFEEDRKFSKVFGFFTMLAIFIAVLGLVGLASYICIQRTKEIGIRKVNGAKISEILTMLNKDFVKWVAIAFVVACPIAYYAMNKWLENFAYKTSLSWWIFALAGLLALGIALLTVSWQSWRAATRNPVEALRYE
jgi:putative ABC transport system permease protein